MKVRLGKSPESSTCTNDLLQSIVQQLRLCHRSAHRNAEPAVVVAEVGDVAVAAGTADAALIAKERAAAQHPPPPGCQVFPLLAFFLLNSLGKNQYLRQSACQAGAWRSHWERQAPAWPLERRNFWRRY